MNLFRPRYPRNKNKTADRLLAIVRILNTVVSLSFKSDPEYWYCRFLPHSIFHICLRQLSAVLDNHAGAGLSRPGSDGFHPLDDVHALDHLSKDHVFSVQPDRIGRAQKELRSVRVGAGVGHAQNPGSRVAESKVLVAEFFAVNGFSARAVVVGEISSLAHESGNDAVKTRSLVSKALFSVVVMRCQWVHVGLVWYQFNSIWNGVIKT